MSCTQNPKRDPEEKGGEGFKHRIVTGGKKKLERPLVHEFRGGLGGGGGRRSATPRFGKEFRLNCKVRKEKEKRPTRKSWSHSSCFQQKKGEGEAGRGPWKKTQKSSNQVGWDGKGTSFNIERGGKTCPKRRERKRINVSLEKKKGTPEKKKVKSLRVNKKRGGREPTLLGGEV